MLRTMVIVTMLSSAALASQLYAHVERVPSLRADLKPANPKHATTHVPVLLTVMAWMILVGSMVMVLKRLGDISYSMGLQVMTPEKGKSQRIALPWDVVK